MRELREDLAGWLVVNREDGDGVAETVDGMRDGAGELPSLHDLREMVRTHFMADPWKIRTIAARYSGPAGPYEVDFTAPYWPQSMPWEHGFNNLKCDYGWWKPEDKVFDVGRSLRTFAASIDSEKEDCKGWVEKTDRFCRAVVNLDASVLDSLTMELLLGTGDPPEVEDSGSESDG